RGHAHVVGEPAGAKEPPRRPRQLRGDRRDEEVVWSRCEPIGVARVGELEHVAADTGPEAVSPPAWADEESMALVAARRSRLARPLHEAHNTFLSDHGDEAYACRLRAGDMAGAVRGIALLLLCQR